MNRNWFKNILLGVFVLSIPLGGFLYFQTDSNKQFVLKKSFIWSDFSTKSEALQALNTAIDDLNKQKQEIEIYFEAEQCARSEILKRYPDVTIEKQKYWTSYSPNEQKNILNFLFEVHNKSFDFADTKIQCNGQKNQNYAKSCVIQCVF